MLKRIVDLVGAGVGAVLLSPVLLTVAVLVRVLDGSPVLFRQTRVGHHGRPFQILKFRTMASSPAPSPQVTVSGDARITRLGRQLRRTKLDELPQLFNVIAGDMSLVGPRPEVPQYVEDWPDEARAVVLSVRPGITDPAAVELFDEEAVLARYPDPVEAYRTIVMPHKLEIYQQYVASRSLTGDLLIMLATVRRALS
ncbi:O-antigen biosynthesis protein WlbG [Nocardioides conyzicola]|uniref:O-antigen biosynthesis protein WlbG n=1 Tax=Nocardioides conyzicola TaxID=1651781 RepID=A0ABP8XE91_9ACTN